MTTFPRLCVRCNAIIPAKEICACQVKANRERKARHDRNRPTAHQRGYTHQWRKLSKQFLEMHRHCDCGQKATLVDHVRPHKGDTNLFWDRNNWQPMCVHCHSKHKQKLERQL